MRRLAVLTLTLSFLLTACDMSGVQNVATESQQHMQQAPTALVQQDARPSPDLVAADYEPGSDIGTNAQNYIAAVNKQFAAQGRDIAVQKIEWMTSAAGSDQAGQTVYANNRELRLASQWVAGDARRNADGNKLTHIAWAPFMQANYGTEDAIDATPIIDATFDTWNDVGCSKLEIETLPATNTNPSAQLAGGNPYQADISTVGFWPGIYFELLLGPGASASVLGVTFSYVFIDETGAPTDVNNDGYSDIALKEVWYNDAFTWATNPLAGIDIESVAVHENGHALGLGHFGKIFVTDKNQKAHFANRAVMNASYVGLATRQPLGTDEGAYCGLYGSWPN